MAKILKKRFHPPSSALGQHSQNRSEASWLDTVQRRGTYADRISAVQLRVQRSPIHSLGSLNALIAAIDVKGIRESYSMLSEWMQCGCGGTP